MLIVLKNWLLTVNVSQNTTYTQINNILTTVIAKCSFLIVLHTPEKLMFLIGSGWLSTKGIAQVKDRVWFTHQHPSLPLL